MPSKEESPTVDRYQSSFEEQVMDPDDFNRTERFREIHAARRRVSDYVSEMEMPKEGTKYFTRTTARLGYVVSLYVFELEPLIEQSVFEDGDLVSDESSYDSLRDFTRTMGLIHSDDKEVKAPTLTQVMSIFSAANRFYAKVGLDLELKVEESDAEFTYADILDDGPPGDGNEPDLEGGNV